MTLLHEAPADEVLISVHPRLLELGWPQDLRRANYIGRQGGTVWARLVDTGEIVEVSAECVLVGARA